MKTMSFAFGMRACFFGGGGATAATAAAAAPRPSPLTRGVLSLSATHAAAWEAIVASNVTTAVFEDDIQVASVRQARTRLQKLARDAPRCDLVLLGEPIE